MSSYVVGAKKNADADQSGYAVCVDAAAIRESTRWQYSDQKMNSRSIISICQLPPGQQPREKTLRKLYLNTNGGPAEVASLVRSLQTARITLAWSADPMATSKGFADISSAVAVASAGEAFHPSQCAGPW